MFAKSIIDKHLCNQQTKGIIALDKQGTQQPRPESPTVTPPGVRVNTRYITSPKVHPQ